MRAVGGKIMSSRPATISEAVEFLGRFSKSEVGSDAPLVASTVAGAVELADFYYRLRSKRGENVEDEKSVLSAGRGDSLESTKKGDSLVRRLDFDDDLSVLDAKIKLLGRKGMILIGKKGVSGVPESKRKDLVEKNRETGARGSAVTEDLLKSERKEQKKRKESGLPEGGISGGTQIAESIHVHDRKRKKRRSKEEGNNLDKSQERAANLGNGDSTDRIGEQIREGKKRKHGPDLD